MKGNISVLIGLLIVLCVVVSVFLAFRFVQTRDFMVLFQNNGQQQPAATTAA